MRTLALNDVGLVRLASFLVKDDIAANRLVPVLEAFNPDDMGELHAVYLGQGGLLSPAWSVYSRRQLFANAAIATSRVSA